MEDQAPNREELLQVATALLSGMCANGQTDFKWPRLVKEAVQGARELLDAVDEASGRVA